MGVAENTPLMGGSSSTTENVDRPKNWKEARDKGWKAPVYTSDESRRDIQKGFLLKVYGLLAAQLGFTVLCVGLFMLVPPLNGFAIGNSWLFLVSFVFSFGFLIALFFLKNSYPWNMYLLVGFTVFESLMIGLLCALYQQRGMGETVAIAWVLTLVVFVVLTLFVQFSQIDFSFLGLLLPISLLILICWSFTALIFGFNLGWFFGAIGALIFSAYILYDTDQIMRHMGCDDHVIAAIELYLDVINLFLMFMMIFSGGSGD